MIKPLDTKAFNYATEQHKKGVKYKDIMVELSKLGYTKARSDSPLCQATLSHYMIENGYRTYTRKTKTPKPKYTKHFGVIPPKFKPAPKAPDNFMLDVIANTELTSEQKIRVLQALI